MCIFSSSVVRSSANITSSIIFYYYCWNIETEKKNNEILSENIHTYNSRLTCFAYPFYIAIQFAFKLLLTTKFKKGLPILYTFSFFGKLSRKNAENKVEHEEGPKYDQGHEVDPVECAAKGVIRLLNKWIYCNKVKQSKKVSKIKKKII